MDKLSEFDEHFIKIYDENNDKGYILEADIGYTKNLFNLHSDLLLLPERKKIKKCKKHNKKKLCCEHKTFKTSIKSWVNTKKKYTKHTK